ncbi:MAG: MipA/OmpV family protein [Pseudomonadota bacterium]
MTRFPLILAAILAGWSGPALAQNPPVAGEDTIQLGGALAYIPQYAGSEDYDLRVLPYIGFDDLAGFELNGLALSYPLLDVGTGQGPGRWSVKAGPRLGFDFGRDSEDSPTLTGFEDIGASLMAGGYLRASFGIFGMRVDAGQDVAGGHDGFNADLSLGTFIPPGIIAERFSVAPSVTLSWADETHNQAIYGVTPLQAAASGLTRYDLSGGFHRASANLVGTYRLDEKWRLNAILSYREYLGDYRDSPILRAPDGSTSNLFTLVAISRSFGL